MDEPKSAIKNKARMVVRTVFRGKRKRHLQLRGSSIKASSSCNIIQDDHNNILQRVTCSEDAARKQLGKMRKIKNNKRQSFSDDNIVKGHKLENSKISLILHENIKLRKKMINQNRQIEDLKRQLNSERSVYEGKIEYLNTVTDCNSNKLQPFNIASVASQTNALECEDYFNSEMQIEDQSHYEVDDLKQLLYKQTLITKCVCSKFIKLKIIKDELLDKLVKTDNFYKLFISEIMKSFEECRIAFVLSKENNLDKDNIKKILEKNARLAYNNAAMQLQLFKLDKELKLAKSEPVVRYNKDDEDYCIIEAVKAKSNEYILTRRPSSMCGSRSSIKKGDWRRPSNNEIQSTTGERSAQKPRISVCGSVISVPVCVINNGRVTYRMTPMFETVTDLQDALQPVSVECDKNFNKVLEYHPDLVCPTKGNH